MYVLVRCINLVALRAVPAIVPDGCGLPPRVSGIFLSVLCAPDTCAFVVRPESGGGGGDVGVVVVVVVVGGDGGVCFAFVGVAVLFGAVAAKTRTGGWNDPPFVFVFVCVLVLLLLLLLLLLLVVARTRTTAMVWSRGTPRSRVRVAARRYHCCCRCCCGCGCGCHCHCCHGTATDTPPCQSRCCRRSTRP